MPTSCDRSRSVNVTMFGFKRRHQHSPRLFFLLFLVCHRNCWTIKVYLLRCRPFLRENSLQADFRFVYLSSFAFISSCLPFTPFPHDDNNNANRRTTFFNYFWSAANETLLAWKNLRSLNNILALAAFPKALSEKVLLYASLTKNRFPTTMKLRDVRVASFISKRPSPKWKVRANVPAKPPDG